MKRIIIPSLLLIMLGACNKNDQATANPEAAVSRQQVEQQQAFADLSNNLNIVLRKSLSGEISLKGANVALIREKLPAVKNADEAKRLFRQANFKGGDQFVDLYAAYMQNVQMLVKALPALKKMDGAALREMLLVKSTLTSAERVPSLPATTQVAGATSGFISVAAPGGDCLSAYNTSMAAFDAQYLSDINGCITGIAVSWLTMDPIEAISNIDCGWNALYRLYANQDNAANAFAACSGVVITP